MTWIEKVKNREDDFFSWCGRKTDPFVDWMMDLPIIFSIPLWLLLMVAVTGIVCVPLVAAEEIFDYYHPCIAWAEPTYHEPIGVLVGGGKNGGGIVVPTGGGTYSDCKERK